MRIAQRRMVGSLFQLLVVFLLVLSAACSAKAPAAQPEDAAPGAQAPTAANGGEQPDGAVAEGGEVITFAAYSFLESAYKPVLEEFHQQYPNITVQVKEMPPTVEPREIASAADTAMLMFRPPSGGGSFLELTPLQEGDASFDPQAFWPGILEACEDAEGRAYGLPVSAEPTGIYYQEKAFDAAGLPHPAPGWTWKDFQKAALALTRTENKLPVYGFADDSFIDTPDETLLSPQISFLLRQNGGDVDVENFERELGWYLDLVQSGSLYPASIYPRQGLLVAPEDKEAWSKAWNGAWANFHEMFLNHPPAMWKGRLGQTYWADAEMKAMPDGSLTMSASAGPILESKAGIGWAPFPVSADGQNNQTTPSAVTCAVISAGTQHPRAAWTWINFLTTHPLLPDWSLAAPARPSAAEESEFWNKIPENLWEPMRFSLEHGWYSSPYPDAAMAVNLALLKAAVEKADLRAALVEASGQVETNVQPAPDTTPVVVAPPEPTTPPGAAAIDFYSPLFFGGDRSKNLVTAFNKLHPDISVQFTTDSSIQGTSDLADAFDCFAWLPEKGLPADKLYDLNQFLLTEEMDLTAEFPPQALDEFSQDGKLYGLPTAYRPNLIYYNADLLAQRGLKPPAIDWTYADFIEMVHAAADHSGTAPVYGFALEYPTADLDMLLAGQNVRLLDSSGSAPAYRFDTPETRAAVEWLAEQVEGAGIFPVTPLQIGTHPENFQAARQLILDGRVAFWMSWFDTGNGGSYGLYDAKFPIGVATIPLPGGTSTWRPYHLALGQYISRKAEHPQACWEWIRFLSEQPDSSYGIPARRSVRESQGWAAQVGPETAAIYQAALQQRRTRAEENIYGLGPVRDWWDQMLAEVVYGAAPLPLLAELQAKADAYSACLAASTGYISGDARQKAQAETSCAERAGAK